MCLACGDLNVISNDIQHLSIFSDISYCYCLFIRSVWCFLFHWGYMLSMFCYHKWFWHGQIQCRRWQRICHWLPLVHQIFNVNPYIPFIQLWTSSLTFTIFNLAFKTISTLIPTICSMSIEIVGMWSESVYVHTLRSPGHIS